jgi:PAS domain S-box-containing protein
MMDSGEQGRDAGRAARGRRPEDMSMTTGADTQQQERGAVGVRRRILVPLMLAIFALVTTCGVSVCWIAETAGLSRTIGLVALACGVVGGGLFLFFHLFLGRVDRELVRRAAGLTEANRNLQSQIDDRKLAEGLLRQSEEKYRHLFAELADAAFLVDAKTGVILDTNVAAEELLDRSRDEIVGMHQSALHPAGEEDKYRQLFAKHVERNPKADDVAEVVTKGGAVVPVRIRASLLVLGGRRLILGLFRDITERKQAEAELRQSEEFIASGIDAQLDTFFVFDPTTGRALRWNRAFRDITGYSDEEIAEWKAPDSYYSPEDLKKAEACIAEVLDEGAATVEIDLICKNERTMPFEYRVSVVRDDQGQPLRMISVGRDITDRKRAEAALRESEEHFRLLSEQSAMGIIILQDDVYKYVNQAAADIFERSIDEMLNWPAKAYLDMVHPDDAALVAEQAQKKQAGREDIVVQYECRAITPTGRVVRVAVHSKPALYDGKSADMITLSDVTARRQAEEELRHARTFTDNLIETANVMIVGLDAQGHVQLFSPAAERITGYSKEDMEGENWFEVLVPKQRYPHVWEEFQRLLAGGMPEVIENPILTKDGEERIITWSNCKIGGSEDNVGTLSFGVDITDRKRAEVALAESEERFRLLYERAPAAYQSLDEDGRFTAVNEAWLELMGYSEEKEKVVGQWLGDFLAPDYREAFKHRFPYFKKEGAIRGVEFEMVRKDGSRIMVAVDGRIGYDAEGNFKQTHCVLHDITAQRRREKNMQLATTVLECLNAHEDKRDMIQAVLAEIQESTGLDAVAIRLHEGDDYPYWETAGFPGEFVEAESSLCVCYENGEIARDADGEPILECMCGNVLRGRMDPAMPFFTEGGSFWTNSTTELLANTSEEDRQGRTRNLCNTAGYESVALIPLRSQTETVGLLQLNDSRKGMFTPESICDMEHLAGSLGIALQRITAEEALRLTQTAVDRSADEVYLLRPDGSCAYANDQASRALGYTREEMLTMSMPDAVPDFTAETVAEMWRELQKKKSILREMYHRTKSGRVYPIEARLSYFELAGKEYMFSFVRDITERRRAEQVLHESEQMLSSFMESATDGFLLFDSELNLTMANRAAMEIFPPGMKREDLLGKNLLDFAPNLRETGRYDRYREVMRTGKPFIVGDAGPYPQYEDRHMSVRAFKVGDGLGMVFSDITERKRVEQELLDHQSQLQRLTVKLAAAEEHQRQQIASLLHDKVDQSLAVSTMNLQLLRKADLSTTHSKALEEAIEQIRGVSRDTRTLMVDICPPLLYEVGLAPAMQHLLAQYERQHGTACKFLLKDEWAPLSDDLHGMLFQIARELLHNVARHAEASSVKVVLSAGEGESVRMSVEDDGVGFDTSELHVSERADGGFGLFSIRERLRHLGGRLEVTSAPGQGTKVIVDLPVSAGQPEATEEKT